MFSDFYNDLKSYYKVCQLIKRLFERSIVSLEFFGNR